MILRYYQTDGISYFDVVLYFRCTIDTQMHSSAVKYRFAIDMNILYAEAAVYNKRINLNVKQMTKNQ